MLRPYTPTVAPCQLSSCEPLRFLDVRLIERIDTQALAQRLRRVFPAQELEAEVERIGREHVGTDGLHVSTCATVGEGGGLLHDRNHPSTVLTGAFGDELLDPEGERGDRGRRAHVQ